MKTRNQMNRRQFVITSLSATAGIAAGINAMPDSRQTRKSDIKVGLYSITFLGVWYNGRALELDEMIKRARGFGYTGVEIDGKRPHGNPLDWPAKRCLELKNIAGSEGIDIYGVAANNDFSSPVPEQRESQIAYVKELIRMTSDLGAKTLRMFLGWPGVTLHKRLATYDIARDIWNYAHSKFSEEETWEWCRSALTECTGYAEDSGVILALQNHKPVIKDYKDVLRMVKEIDSPNLKVSLDVPIMDDKSRDNIMKAAKSTGNLQVLSHFGGEYDRGADGRVAGEDFYRSFVEAMNEIEYKGYMSYELCHPLPVVNGTTVGLDFAEKNAKLAAEFMNGLIKEVTA